jgi:uncharacterized protein YcbK (DUF882 family)
MDLHQNLSKNFRLFEFVYSETAKRLKIENNPTDVVVENLKNLCEFVLEPLRELVGKPIKINSGYRCFALNEAVGGSKESQHMQGKAADLKVDGMTVAEVVAMIRNSEIQYDQLIEEKFVPTMPGSGWVHVSWNSPTKNRKKSFKIA